MKMSITGNFICALIFICTGIGEIGCSIEYHVIFDKKCFFPGEKITFKLQFRYPADKFVRVRSIQDPEIQGIEQIKITAPDLRETNEQAICTWHGSCFAS